MKYWKKYCSLIKMACLPTSSNASELAYWRSELFAHIIICLLPLSLIALVPGLYWSYKSGLYTLMALDILLVGGMLAIAFVPYLTLRTRKIIFVTSAYSLSYFLLHELGTSGPGLVYLLASGIFSILIFPSRYAFWSAWLNSLICVLYALLIGFNIIKWPYPQDHQLGEWIAVSSNVVFLSFLCSALIPRLFNGLQETIEKEKNLKLVLEEQQEYLQQALDMLRQKNKELEQFAYVASHDLNEPLRMITSFMALLKQKYHGHLDERAHTYISFALDGGVRMQKMIADLLEFSRTGTAGATKEPIVMEDILTEVKQNMLKLIEESRTVLIHNGPFPIFNYPRSDITRLTQNLLSNAIKFRKDGVRPIIELAVSEKKSGWLFSIKDNGIGIEKGELQNIFKVFTRLHSRDEYEGTGIGLAICKKIAEQNGGQIWVESEEGQGCIFYFIIKK